MPAAVARAPPSSPALLLALLLLAACAAAQVGEQLGLQDESYVLRDGSASGSVRVRFILQEGLIDSAHDYQPRAVDESPDKIVDVVKAVFDVSLTPSFMTVQMTMTGFPGRSKLNCSILLPSGVKMSQLLHINVLGIVLLDQNKRDKYTGKNANVLSLRDDTVTTVDALVFNAPQLLEISVPLDAIRVRLSDNRYKHLLPWDHNLCNIYAPPASLNDNCSMAFFDDFRKFSFRIPQTPNFMTPLSMPSRLELVFEWAPAAALPSSNSDSGAAPDRSDIITTALLRYPKVRRPFSSLSGWKIALITVTAIAASVTVVIFASCCICAARHRSSDRSSSFSNKVLLRRVGRHHTLVNMEKRESFSPMEDLLPDAEPRSRSVYSQDTLGPVSDSHTAADDQLIPDAQMLAALMARESVNTTANGVGDDDLGVLSGDNERGCSVDEEVELALQMSRSRLERREETHVDGRGDAGGAAAAAKGTTRTAKERMAFGAACERMKVVNMLVGPVSRGLISAYNAPMLRAASAADEGGASEEEDVDDEIMRFSSEEYDMDMLDGAQARGAGGAGAGGEGGAAEGGRAGDGPPASR